MKILDSLTIGGTVSHGGSFFEKCIWPSDIDLIEMNNVDAGESQTACLIYVRKMKGMISNATKSKNIVVYNITWDVKMDPETFLDAHEQYLARVLDDKDTKVKLDAVVWIPEEARFRLVSVIFVFYANERRLNYMPDSSVRSLQADVNKQVREGQFWKALKRMWTIAKKQNDVKARDEIQALIDGELGAFSSCVSELEALDVLLATNEKMTRQQRKNRTMNIQGCILRLNRVPFYSGSIVNAKVLYQLERIAKRNTSINEAYKAIYFAKNSLQLILQRESLEALKALKLL